MARLVEIVVAIVLVSMVAAPVAGAATSDNSKEIPVNPSLTSLSNDPDNATHMENVTREWVYDTVLAYPAYQNGYIYGTQGKDVYKVNATDGTQVATNTFANTITGMEINDDYVFVTTPAGLFKLQQSDLATLSSLTAASEDDAKTVSANSTSVFYTTGNNELIWANENDLAGRSKHPIDVWGKSADYGPNNIYYGQDTNLTREDHTFSNTTHLQEANARIVLTEYHNGSVYMGREHLWRLDPDTGEVEWKYTGWKGEKLSAMQRIAWDKYHLYVQKNGDLLKLEKATGKKVGRINNSGADHSKLVEVDKWLVVSNGTHMLKIDKNSFTQTSSMTTPEHKELQLDVRPFVQQNKTQRYEVFLVTNDSSQNVTTDATVTSENTSILSVSDFEVTASKNINATVNVTAEYTGNDGIIYSDTKEITVAQLDLEHADILPGAFRLSATFNNDSIFVIFIATLVGIVGARGASSFAGLSMMTLAVIVAWFGGFTSTGIMLVTVFTATFIGLNIAANINYMGGRSG